MIDPENLEVVRRYEGTIITVFSFTKDGQCPNCLKELKLNQFGNWECYYCLNHLGKPKLERWKELMRLDKK